MSNENLNEETPVLVVPTPTQVAQPAQAVKRTVVQNIAATILGAAAFLGVVAIAAPDFLAAIAVLLPAEWLAYATAGVVGIGTVAGVVTKLMAIPAVNAWLTKHGNLGATSNKGE